MGWVKAGRENSSAASPGSNAASNRGWAVWKLIERALLTAGLSLLAVYGVVKLEGCVNSRAALKSFAALESSASYTPPTPRQNESSSDAGFNNRDQDRLHISTEGRSQHSGAPMAALEIAKIGLAVPLLDGTDDLTLNHAVGRIAGTARPGQQGNIGIAGHRDGYFRRLKEVGPGDTIELRTVKGTDKYVVDQIRIVTPDNVGVLRPRPVSSLTLVTCYPFHFIGSAPLRYIVMASVTHERDSGSRGSMPDPNSPTSTINEENK